LDAFLFSIGMNPAPRRVRQDSTAPVHEKAGLNPGIRDSTRIMNRYDH
jgi:hypothetical protein